MKFTVKRDEWLRGTGDGMLYDPTSGKRCCLGFLALACGYTDDDIANLGMLEAMANPSAIPETIAYTEPGFYAEFKFRSTSQCNKAANVNDSMILKDSEREASLIEIFKLANIEVEFV